MDAGYRIATLYSVDPWEWKPCGSHADRQRSSGAAGPISKAAFKPWLAAGHRHLGWALLGHRSLRPRLGTFCILRPLRQAAHNAPLGAASSVTTSDSTNRQGALR